MTGAAKKDTSTIQRNTVADQVYADLRGRILSGEIPQGERIVEAALAKSLGISRAPVREAVNRLTEAGLLESRTHFSTTVLQMTPEKVRQLYAVRVAVETLAIREVVRRHRPEDIDLLKGLIKEMMARAKAKDVPGLVEAELAFHEALWKMAANPYVDRVAGLLFDHMRLALTVDNAGYSDLMDVAREHEPLLAAITGGDPDKAAQALSAHIMTSLETFVPSV